MHLYTWFIRYNLYCRKANVTAVFGWKMLCLCLVSEHHRADHVPVWAQRLEWWIDTNNLLRKCFHWSVWNMIAYLVFIRRTDTWYQEMLCMRPFWVRWWSCAHHADLRLEQNRNSLDESQACSTNSAALDKTNGLCLIEFLWLLNAM